MDAQCGCDLGVNHLCDRHAQERLRPAYGDTIKAVSLWQPWAEAMRLKLKKNETRSWYTGHRGWLAIHAAKRRIENDPDCAYVMRLSTWLRPESLAYGAVICIVKLVGCERTERIATLITEREREFGNYAPGRFAWITSPLDMIELEEPVPLRGHQGLFDWKIPYGVLKP